MRDREAIILSELNTKKRVRVSELSELLDVTTETIRRDLESMERKELLVRVFGGAVLPYYNRTEERMEDVRSKLKINVKKALAKAAAEDILPGESIVIDNGTTCLELAKIIAPRNDLTIITPSIRIAQILYEGGKNKVFVLGGWLRESEPSVSGASAIEILRRFNVDRTYMSAASVDTDSIREYMDSDGDIKRTALEISDRNILIADSDKFKARALIKVAEISAFNEIFTDSNISEDVLKTLRKKGINVTSIQIDRD